jgi:hypothetical protein
MADNAAARCSFPTWADGGDKQSESEVPLQQLLDEHSWSGKKDQ